MFSQWILIPPMLMQWIDDHVYSLNANNIDRLDALHVIDLDATNFDMVDAYVVDCVEDCHDNSLNAKIVNGLDVTLLMVRMPPMLMMWMPAS